MTWSNRRMAASAPALTARPTASPVLPTGEAGPGTLQYAVRRWHEQHPDFVAVLPCMAPVAADPDARQLAAARRAGVSLSEYRERTAAEQRYCTAHRDWHHVSAFSDAVTNTTRACKSWRNERQRTVYRQKRRTS